MDTIWPVPATPPPPGFERSRALTPEQLLALPGPSQEAIQTLERCIESRHVAGVDYTDAAGDESTIRIRPAYIRHNSAGHLVLWGIPTDRDHWEELRLDRIRSARDTGEEFTPTW